MLWRLSSKVISRWARSSRIDKDYACNEGHTNTARNKAVSDLEMKCVSRRLSIGGDCLKNQCPRFYTYGHVVFADTVLFLSLVNVT